MKRIDSVKSKLTQITEPPIETPTPRELSTVASNAEEQIHAESTVPAAPVATQPADFLSHLIENVTETGTEPVPQEAEDEIALPEPGDLKLQT